MRDKIIHEAISWVGTPFIRNACIKGLGVDCALLAGGIAIELGLIQTTQLKDIPVYDLEYHIHNKDEKMFDILKSFGCVQLNIQEMQPGDIMTFRYGRSSSHLGILIDNSQFVHANSEITNPRVVVNTLNERYLKILTAAFKFPGVE